MTEEYESVEDADNCQFATKHSFRELENCRSFMKLPVMITVAS